MDERERMRSVLAEKAMGWTLLVDYDDFYGYGEPSWFFLGRIQYPQSQWDPFNSWHQAGDLIEEMRAKGWECRIDWPTNFGASAKFSKLIDFDRMRHATSTGHEQTVCEAVSEAAYRALEATDE